MSNSEVKDQANNDSNVAYDSNNSTPFYFYEKLSGNNDNEFKRPKLMPPLSWENLVPPSEVFEKEINKFGSTLSTERKGEKTDENSEQILVDFDYLNALSEMPNIEPLKG
ncbi:hypothetical protein C9374_007122 [Naegleria lovaniensis]|uniref:Uncharacterized protein n=1 Tax=Naegleria lovaniensis TaxID=51637 RepID=A0AA88KRU2_NAELO|nr:uncharacterized protein C9374_007122 [Naegleria lovaniensis]KAG2393591.1 hypothetical protein C9374_007122 [Naegleria lovaniensis]